MNTRQANPTPTMDKHMSTAQDPPSGDQSPSNVVELTTAHAVSYHPVDKAYQYVEADWMAHRLEPLAREGGAHSAAMRAAGWNEFRPGYYEHPSLDLVLAPSSAPKSSYHLWAMVDYDYQPGGFVPITVDGALGVAELPGLAGQHHALEQARDAAIAQTRDYLPLEPDTLVHDAAIAAGTATTVQLEEALDAHQAAIGRFERDDSDGTIELHQRTDALQDAVVEARMLDAKAYPIRDHLIGEQMYLDDLQSQLAGLQHDNANEQVIDELEHNIREAKASVRALEECSAASEHLRDAVDVLRHERDTQMNRGEPAAFTQVALDQAVAERDRAEQLMRSSMGAVRPAIGPTDRWYVDHRTLNETTIAPSVEMVDISTGDRRVVTGQTPQDVLNAAQLYARTGLAYPERVTLARTDGTLEAWAVSDHQPRPCDRMAEQPVVTMHSYRGEGDERHRIYKQVPLGQLMEVESHARSLCAARSREHIVEAIGGMDRPAHMATQLPSDRFCALVERTIGPRPTEPEAAQRWQEAVQAVVGFRDRHGVTDQRSLLGPTDLRPDAREAQLFAHSKVRASQRGDHSLAPTGHQRASAMQLGQTPTPLRPSAPERTRAQSRER